MNRAVLAALSLLALPAAAHGQGGVISSSFAQLAGADGCMVQTMPAGYYYDEEGDQGTTCRETFGLLQAEGVAVSPDQRNVYVASSGTARSGSNAVAAFGRDATAGRLTPLGCISDDGGDGRTGSDGLCKDGDALAGANDVAVTPDGRHVYVSSSSSHGLAWFERDPATGALTQIGCAKAFPRADRCIGVPALEGANGVAISPDGANVYVSSGTADAVVALRRDAETGRLTPAGCVSATGSDGLCTDGTALQAASSVAVSPDGAFVYVTSFSTGAVTIHRRDGETGALTPSGCILDRAPAGGACADADGLQGASAVALSPDGRHAYVAAVRYGGGALVTMARDASTGAVSQTGCLRNAWPEGDDAVTDPGEEDEDVDDDEEELEGRPDPFASCEATRAIAGVTEVVVSPDGRSVFTASSGQLAAFDRNPETGALRQAGCAESDPTYRSCVAARGLYGASGIATSTDGRSLYVASRNSQGVAIFGAAVAITSRAGRVSRAGIARVRLACPVARARGCAGRLTVAGRGPAFRLRAGARRTVAMRLPADLRRLVRAQRVRVTVRASDARRVTRASARRLTLRAR